jgi:hypothetical protein
LATFPRAKKTKQNGKISESRIPLKSKQCFFPRNPPGDNELQYKSKKKLVETLKGIWRIGYY